MSVGDLLAGGSIFSGIWIIITRWWNSRRLVPSDPLEGMSEPAIRELARLEEEFPTEDALSLAAVAKVKQWDTPPMVLQGSYSTQDFQAVCEQMSQRAGLVARGSYTNLLGPGLLQGLGLTLKPGSSFQAVQRQVFSPEEQRQQMEQQMNMAARDPYGWFNH